MEKVKKTKIVLKNFWGIGEHIYQEDLGWQELQKWEAHSLVSRDIFEFQVVKIMHNLAFYYIDNDTFYGLHTEWDPIEFFIFDRDRTEEFLGFQCSADTHEGGEVLYTFDELDMRIWDTIKIDGKSLEEVLERSFIIRLT